MKTRDLLARNIRGLMNLHPELSTPRKLAPHCSTPTRSIGARTIAHLLDPKSTVQPQLDTIVAIAEAFKVRPWMLLTPDFEPFQRTGGALPGSAILSLAQRIADLPQQKRELLGEIFSDAVPDDELERNGIRAPNAPNTHKDSPTYQKGQRQLKMKLHR